MQFVSFTFLIFLPIVVMINYVLPRKYRYIWMLVTSMAFYIAVDVKGTLVMALSILTTYGAGLFIEKKKEKSRAIFVLCLVLNIGILLVCKYLGFFAGAFVTVSILAPLGISFYILKAVGYLIDVERGDIKAERNILKYALFVSFFPQVVSGPIERARNMLPQFTYPLTVDFYRLRDGFLQMLWGYFLKLVVADRLAIFVNSVFSKQCSGTITFIATLFYTFEIYCDFSGYSHIAIGAARLLGIDVMKNFDSPYMAKSIAEFWRRWHISLSTWFRDYLYIPLGGNRKGSLRKYLNILIVFIVSGLWHGADFTFIVWGLIHGIYQLAGYILKPVRDKMVELFKVDRESFSHIIFKTAVTFLLVNFAWVFFRAETLAQAVNIIGRSLAFTPWSLSNGELFRQGLDQANMTLVMLGILVVVCADIANYKGVAIREKILSLSWWLRWGIMIAAIILILVCGVWGPGYDATSFIYQQF